jgi:formyl-CoA transferase
MALIGKQKTGKGTFVSTSLQASGIWCNAIGMVSHQPQFAGDRTYDALRPADPFCHFYQCADNGWVGIFDNEYRRELPKFAGLFEMPELLENPNCATLEALTESDEVINVVKKLNGIFKTKTSDQWIEFLEENNVSCEKMRRISDICQDEQAKANEYIEEVEFKDGLKVVMPCTPVKFSEYVTRPYVPAGRLGEDTDEIFTDLGYAPEQIDELKQTNAII